MTHWHMKAHFMPQSFYTTLTTYKQLVTMWIKNTNNWHITEQRQRWKLLST